MMTTTVAADSDRDSRFAAEPLAGNSAQFPLSRGAIVSDLDEVASPTGVRPWGLRRMAAIAPQGVPGPLAGEYDPVQQVRADGEGRPLIAMGPPTAPTTGSQDGSEGDQSEDYHND